MPAGKTEPFLGFPRQRTVHDCGSRISQITHLAGGVASLAFGN